MYGRKEKKKKMKFYAIDGIHTRYTFELVIVKTQLIFVEVNNETKNKKLIQKSPVFIEKSNFRMIQNENFSWLVFEFSEYMFDFYHERFIFALNWVQCLLPTRTVTNA